ncbi:MAG: NAD(P)-dependent oxidoreductase [Lentisphaeria bacterium]|nr:NAD(P)-dependent oxidoreductase [Lentisphaeria bacterium]
MQRIGFIGTGVMGKSICKHLFNAFGSLKINSRTPSKATELIEMGCKWLESPAYLASECDLIFTMLGYPQDIEDVYLGDHGILVHAPTGACLIDLTTSTPSLAMKLEKLAIAKGLMTLDAPVSGGDIGASAGTLSIMVGGQQSTFNEYLPILKVFGKNIVYQGAAGSGQHTKCCNQIVVAGNMLGAVESMIYAQANGLDPEQILKSIGAGAASSWALNNLALRMTKGDYEAGFFIKHFVKDLKIALSEAKSQNLKLSCLENAYRVYKHLEDQGFGELGTQGVIKAYL